MHYGSSLNEIYYHVQRTWPEDLSVGEVKYLKVSRCTYQPADYYT